MPISPTVNSFMAQNQMAQTQPSDQIFRTKFTDSAFSTLRAKFPNLASLVVSLKVIEADVDKGFALAAFIIRAAKDVRYIPVVMVEGSIASCEMLYDKGSNQLMPLLPKVAKDIAAMNAVDTAVLLDKRPSVDQTKGLFHNMLRPPTSSNPVLASNMESAVQDLPNSAKKQVAEYLENNPQILGKIAEFYPVDVLAEKLAEVVEQPLPKVDYPSVVSFEDLCEKTAALLSEADRISLLHEGFTVTKELPTSDTIILPVEKIAAEVEEKFNLVEFPHTVDSERLAHVGTAFKIKASGVDEEEVLFNLPDNGIIPVGGGSIYELDAYVSLRSQHKTRVSALVSSHRLAKESDLLSFGAVPVTRASDTPPGYVTRIFYPRKKGFGISEIYGSFEVNKSDSGVSLKSHGAKIFFSPGINYGCVKTQEITTYPLGSFIGVYKREGFYPYIRSAEEFLKFVKKFGKRVRMIQDGPTTSLNTGERFTKKADLAKHLVDTYGLGRLEVHQLLDAKDAYVFQKNAFLTQPAAVDNPATVQQGAQAPIMAQQAQPQQQFNPQVMQDFMQMQDPEMFDTGIIASFAGDQDIKSNFVDLLPNFLENLSSLGRVILICSIQKKEMEAYYGREKYQTFLTNVRRVFKTLGEIVLDLKEYVNMTV